METYKQDFEWVDSDPFFRVNGSNIYGILRSQRAHSVESLVLLVSYEQNANFSDWRSHLSVGVAYELFRYFKSLKTLSRDFILLVTEGGDVGVQAWLTGYHYFPLKPSPTGLRYSPIRGYAGELLGGFSIDVRSLLVSGLQLSIAGPNGIQPNSDLLKLISSMSEEFNLHVSIEKQLIHSAAFLHEYLGAYLPFKLSTDFFDLVVNMLLSQITGLPNGPHGPFLNLNIPFVTVRTLEGTKSNGVDILYFGRIIEKVMRVLDTVEEKLHQSFFYYILVTDKHFLPLSLYFIPALFFFLSVSALSLGLWLHCISLIGRANPRAVNPAGDHLPKNLTESRYFKPHEPKGGLAFSLIAGQLRVSFFLAGLSILLAGFSTLLLLHFPTSVCTCTFASMGLFSALVSVPRWVFRSPLEGNWRLLKYLTATCTSSVVLGIFFLNFPLGVMVSLVAIPLLLWARPLAEDVIGNKLVSIIFRGHLYPLLIPPVLITATEKFLRRSPTEDLSLFTRAYYLLGVWSLPLVSFLLWFLFYSSVIILFCPRISIKLKKVIDFNGNNGV
ncbi:glycosylphosphatidylinositol anchor attachment 1 protein-like [Zophobas morio]|uniref:glycosylphosphatidylinositol anchor attachment 1 protein-like n=1 Tax=Zophobas morio TaxID=2755281 RepID=UPI0030827D37